MNLAQVTSLQWSTRSWRGCLTSLRGQLSPLAPVFTTPSTSNARTTLSRTGLYIKPFLLIWLFVSVHSAIYMQAKGTTQEVEEVQRNCVWKSMYPPDAKGSSERRNNILGVSQFSYK